MLELNNCQQERHLANATGTGVIRIGSHAGHDELCFIITNSHLEKKLNQEKWQ